MTTDNDQKQFSDAVLGVLHHYHFKNNHIMRGPLCRATGLLYLIKKTDVDQIQKELIEMLQYEIDQMNDITLSIGRMLHEYEEQLIANSKNENEISNI